MAYRTGNCPVEVPATAIVFNLNSLYACLLNHRLDFPVTRWKLRRAGVPHPLAIRRVLGPAVSDVANVANVNRHTPS